jgi:hypothetical protein
VQGKEVALLFVAAFLAGAADAARPRAAVGARRVQEQVLAAPHPCVRVGGHHGGHPFAGKEGILVGEPGTELGLTLVAFGAALAIEHVGDAVLRPGDSGMDGWHDQREHDEMHRDGGNLARQPRALRDPLTQRPQPALRRRDRREHHEKGDRGHEGGFPATPGNVLVVEALPEHVVQLLRAPREHGDVVRDEVERETPEPDDERHSQPHRWKRPPASRDDDARA